jgi:chromosome segregation ATPase
VEAKEMRVPFFKQFTLGLLISAVLMGGAAPPARAQFAVYDHLAWTQRLAEYVKEANRWLQTVQHYEAVIRKAEQQVMTLGGILTTVDKMVARDDSIFASFASLGQSIRGILTLKEQVEALVVRNIQSLKNIDDRLKGGIFNPQADLADLENYLRNSIGRASQDRVATLERVANMDTLLQRWYEELQMLQARKATITKQREDAVERLKAEEAKPKEEGCATCIESIKQEIAWCDDELIKLDEQISAKLTQIEERMKKWNVEMRERGDTARDVQEIEESWDKFFSVREEVLYELDNYSGSHRRPIDQ